MSYMDYFGGLSMARTAIYGLPWGTAIGGQPWKTAIGGQPWRMPKGTCGGNEVSYGWKFMPKGACVQNEVSDRMQVSDGMQNELLNP